LPASFAQLDMIVVDSRSQRRSQEATEWIPDLKGPTEKIAMDNINIPDALDDVAKKTLPSLRYNFSVDFGPRQRSILFLETPPIQTEPWRPHNARVDEVFWRWHTQGSCLFQSGSVSLVHGQYRDLKSKPHGPGHLPQHESVHRERIATRNK
jgi:hypothetical protein